MRVILTQDVAGLGGPGEVVEVADGYGRNFLLPRKLAMLANRGAEKQIAAISRARQARRVRDRGQAQEEMERIRALEVRIVSRAGNGGRLFGSVTPADVVEAVRGAGGPAVDRRQIEMPAAPIKSVGTFQVGVRLHPDVRANIDVQVVAAG